MKRLCFTLLMLCLESISPIPADADSLKSPELLQDQEYSQLPAGVCSGYAENLVGKFAGREYGSLICDRPEASYLLLQKLVGYTDTDKAIWKVIRIEKVPKPGPQEQLVNAGCFSQNQTPNSIVALVKETNSQPYPTIQAWRTDLASEQFQPLLPDKVACFNPGFGATLEVLDCP